MLFPRSLMTLWLPLFTLPALAASPPGTVGAEDDTEQSAAHDEGAFEQGPHAEEADAEPDADHPAEDGADEADEVEGFLADRCPELTGPPPRHARHARWRQRHRVDVDFGGAGWEVAMRGDVPERVRTGLFEGATIVNVQPVSTEQPGGVGGVAWVALVDLSGDLAQLCDADQVELRLDDAFGRGAHVIALHHEGVLLRDRDNELVFLSAEDSEQVPEIELVYTSSFQLVNAPKVSKAKKKRRKKRRRRRR